MTEVRPHLGCVSGKIAQGSCSTTSEQRRDTSGSARTSGNVYRAGCTNALLVQLEAGRERGKKVFVCLPPRTYPQL